MKTFPKDSEQVVPSTWQGFPTDVLDEAQTLADGGGGWQAAGPKGGRYRERSGSYLFVLKCACACAFACPAQIAIEITVNLVQCSPCATVVAAVAGASAGVITIWQAAGWPHKHNGPCLLKRGLPPTVKADMMAKLAIEPRIKANALFNYLVEQCKHPSTIKSKIRIFLHNHRKETTAMAMGYCCHSPLPLPCPCPPPP